MFNLKSFCLALFLGPMACLAKNVIIATDAATDDWMAIAYLIQHPDVNIKAITVTGTGEAHCKAGVRNVLRILHRLQSDDVPVTCGTETPYPLATKFPNSWRVEVDRLSGIPLAESPNAISPLSAVDLIKKTATAFSGDIDVVALGPLTNLANLIEQQPEFFKKHIRSVFIMGGAVDTPGNVRAWQFAKNRKPKSENKVAEWNIFADPQAARIVFASAGVPINLVPLNITNQVPIDNQIYTALTQGHRTVASDFVHQVIKASLDFMDSHCWFFWDPLAAAIYADNSIASYQQKPLSITLGSFAKRGETTLDKKHGTLVNVYMKVKKKAFRAAFVSVLQGRLGKVSPISIASM